MFRVETENKYNDPVFLHPGGFHFINTSVHERECSIQYRKKGGQGRNITIRKFVISRIILTLFLNTSQILHESARRTISTSYSSNSNKLEGSSEENCNIVND